MEEKKMTDEEIVASFKCCRKNDLENTCAYCIGCPASNYYAFDYEGDEECIGYVMRKAIESVQRLTEENKRLTREYERITYNKQEYLELVDGFLKTHTVMKDRGEDYKMFDREWMCNTFWAKIESSLDYIIDLENQRNELQTKVDELKEENRQLVTIGNGFALERNNLREELDELKKSSNGVLLTSLYKKQADDHKRGLSVQRAYWKKKLRQAVKDTAKEIFILAEDYNCGGEDDIDNFMSALKERYGVEVE